MAFDRALACSPNEAGRTPLRSLATAALVAALVAALAPTDALALPNSHAASISTWDARASSVVFGLGRVVSGDAEFTAASYSANFSSTSGVLSAQFGIHYLTYRPEAEAPLSRGVSAGGVALLTFPLADRHSGGIPGQSLSLYLGGVPTALIGKQRNFVSVPFVLGVGLPYSPWPSLTLTPWAELSPGLSFDTRIQPVSTQSAVDSALDGTLTREEVEQLVDEGIEVEGSTALGKRAGVSLSVHLGESFDVDVNVLLGAGGSGAAAMTGALVYRWDDQVPGVVGEERRLSRASCGAVEARFRSCPAARRYVVREAVEARPAAVRPPAAATRPAAAPRPAASPSVTPRPSRSRVDGSQADPSLPAGAAARRAIAGSAPDSQAHDEDGETSGERAPTRASRPKQEPGVEPKQEKVPQSVHDLPPLRAAPRK